MSKKNTEEVASKLYELLTSKKMDQRFTAYHPYLTYSEPSNTRFVRNSKILDFVKETGDTAELFRIGREIYKRLPKVKSKKDFNSILVPRYFKFIEKWRCMLSNKCSQKTFNLFFPDSEILKINWDEAGEHMIFAMVWYGIYLITI